ncbi:ATP-binding protein [Aquitalea magnusonii]|uniref:histidine kinase n=2 Tax=Aquitalea magnusonii TaxID=332411 RepID=A0A318JPE0_9NEIS|nr:ATP-binding protein [Aquitalea magnusonii]PXX51059.1 PAS domain S-box-containing protein [Aquitalea magnusonii]
MPAQPTATSHPASLLHRHLKLLQETDRRRKWLLAGFYLLLCALLALLLVHEAMQRQQQALDGLASQLQADINSHMQLALATMDHASMLLPQQATDPTPQLRDFAGLAAARQPFIDYLGWQPRIRADQRARFEQQQSQLRGQAFAIRDYWPTRNAAGQDSGNYVPAPPRHDYLPLLMQEPAPSAALRAMQGLDLLHDPLLGQTVQQAVSQGSVQFSPPSRIAEHWHLLLLQARYAANPPSPNPLVRSEQLQGVLLLSLQLDGLLAASTAPYRGLQLDLLAPDGSASPLVSGQQSGGNSLLPVQGAQQPVVLPVDGYRLQLAQPLAWQQLSLPLLAVGLVANTLLCYLLWLLAAQQQRQRNIRRRAMDHLHREREHASVTLQAIADAVVTFDTTFRIQYINPSASMLLGPGHHSVIGQNVRQLLRLGHEFARPGDTDPFTQAMQIRDNVYLPDSSYLTRSSGEKLLVEGCVSPVFDQQTRLLGAVLTLRDTAPRRQHMLAALEASERRLRQHEQELARVARINTMGEMASGIAHEINQPLSAIVSYCQASLSLLAEEDPDLPLVCRAMQSAAHQAQRAGQVIQRLREFVSKRNQHQSLLDPNQIVANALALLEFELQSHDIHLEQYFSDKLSAVYADNIQLEQVILNILRNAIDAMESVHPWGRLIISTEQDATRVRIMIADNGPGIATALQDKIFDPFFSTKPNGMGLGLAICQTAIDNMGGQILASNRPSGGAQFVIDLPALTTSTAQAVAGEQVS